VERETAAAVDADGDGQVGTVTIGPQDGAAVNGARRRIELILDPPKAEIGAVYAGKVVNVTKFGAFVNILPGRDGLLHISKLGQGRRVERVEDVVNLGDELEVRVDDIDPQGKVSLSLVGDAPEAEGNGSAPSGTTEQPRVRLGGDEGAGETVSFEDFFEEAARKEVGDLGPD